MVVSVVIGFRHKPIARHVGFMVIDKSKKLTLSLVSWVGISLTFLWIVLMYCSMLLWVVCVES